MMTRLMQRRLPKEIVEVEKLLLIQGQELPGVLQTSRRNLIWLESFLQSVQQQEACQRRLADPRTASDYADALAAQDLQRLGEGLGLH